MPMPHRPSFIVGEVDGTGPGIQSGIFNATDPDRSAGQLRYKELHDPANGVNVDEGSGTVATRKRTDRESPCVNDNFYIIIVHATDDGTGGMLDVRDWMPALLIGTAEVGAHLGAKVYLDATVPSKPWNAESGWPALWLQSGDSRLWALWTEESNHYLDFPFLWKGFEMLTSTCCCPSFRENVTQVVASLWES
ncbi:Cadherin-like protein 26 [Manis javanica]|nr:Cadherin-like protein 26 [Manis javanica]